MSADDGTTASNHTEPKVYLERMLRFFEHRHLPENLAAVSRPFCELAAHMVVTIPRNPERSAGLRKLLEAKDCAVRAVLEGEVQR